MDAKPAFLFPQDNAQPLGTGILPSQAISDLISTGKILSPEPILDGQIQPASLDLRLGRMAYKVQASFLPGEGTVEKKIRDLCIEEINLEESAVFDKNEVFIVPLVEGLALPSDVYGKANPKSTTGRLDIFTRLITETAKEFESVPRGYRGPLYLEVVSRTFPIVVRKGLRLSQLRLIRGKRQQLSDTSLDRLADTERLVYGDDDTPLSPQIQRGLSVSVDLQGNGNNIVAYKAKKDRPRIDLAKIGHYDVDDFWEAIPTPRPPGLILNAHDFYILASAERISVPPTHAAEMVPFDPSLGEFRIHYAGFFDPGFGHGVDGTKAVLEVRAHEVPVLLEDRQLVGKLIYHQMAQMPSKIYGGSIGSSYQRQGLTLSKQFKQQPGACRDPNAQQESRLVPASVHLFL